MKQLKPILFLLLVVLVKTTNAQLDSATLGYNSSGGIAFARLATTNSIDSSNAVTYLQNLLANGNTDVNFVVKSNLTDEFGIQHLKYDETYKGIKVYTGEYLVHIKNAAVKTINGNFVPISLSSVTPALTESQALTYALSSVNANSYKWQNPNWEAFIKQAKNDNNATYYPQGKLYIIPHNLFNNTTDILAYLFTIATDSPDDDLSVVIDANTGALINKKSILCNGVGSAETIHSGTQNINCDQQANGDHILQESFPTNLPNIGTTTTIHTINYNYGLNTEFTNSSSQNQWTSNAWANYTTDKAGLDVHWGIEMTLGYWANQRQRASYDGNNSKVTSTVNYMTYDKINQQWKYWNNAKFDLQTHSLFFGKCDGTYFPDVSPLDWVAHEFAHLFTDNTTHFAGLSVENDALNEGFSDIWSACVKDYVNNLQPPILTTAQQKKVWLWGAENINPVLGPCIRDMQNPTQSWVGPNNCIARDCYQSQSWNSMLSTPCSDGHIASGVVNRWFYLLSQGGSGKNEVQNTYNVNGITIENAAKILFQAEKYYLFQGAMFYDARWATVQAAIDLYGYVPNGGTIEEVAVTNAWYAVNVGEKYKNFTNCVPGAYLSLTSLPSNINAANIYIPKDITIAYGQKSIFTNSNVILESGVKIKVESGGELYLNGSHFFTCQGLWKGIVLDPGGKVNIDGSTTNSSLIEDAETAISCDYGGSSISYAGSTLISATNTIFNRNDVGIKIENYTALNNTIVQPFVINNCIFTSIRLYSYGLANNNPPIPNYGVWDNVATMKPYVTGAIYPPYPATPVYYDRGYINENYFSTTADTYVKNHLSGYSQLKPQAGIVLNNVTGVKGGILVGVIGTTANPNTTIFDNLKVGIAATQTNLTVRNCTFQRAPVGGIGISVDNGTINNPSDKIVDISNPALGYSPNNAFYDMTYAISIVAGKQTTVNSCDITSTQSITDINNPSTLKGAYGIRIGSSNYDGITITGNHIFNVKNAISVSESGLDRPSGLVYLNSGNINVDGNVILKQQPGALNQGSEYVKNAINLSVVRIRSSGGANNSISCKSNNIKDVFNGICGSYWQGKNIEIKDNEIGLVADPANTSNEYYGIKLEAGSGANGTNDDNIIQDNKVTGSGIGNKSTAIWLAQQNNTNLGCNYVYSADRGFKFEGTNLFTKFSDNRIYPSNKYGVTFANNGQIDKQGNEANTYINGVSQDDICTSNNNWIAAKSITNGTWLPPVSYMMFCDNTSVPANSPFVVRINSTSNTGLNPDGACWSASGGSGTFYSSANGLIYALAVDGSNCIRCNNHPPAQRIANIPHLLDEIAAGTVLLPNDNPDERLRVMQQQLYDLARRQPDIAQNSSDIQQFIYDNQWSSLDFIYYAGYYASTGNMAMVNDLLNYWTPDGTPLDENYFQYYGWLVNMYNDPNWRPDSTDLATLANKCPITNGTIVYAARNLYNAITGNINNFDNSCDANQGARGINNKPTEFIRLKQPKQAPITQLTNKQIDIYPNPAKSIATVFSNTGNIKQIEIVDMLGRIVLNKTSVNNNKVEINTKELQKGIFLVRVTNDKNIVTIQKLIVE